MNWSSDKYSSTRCLSSIYDRALTLDIACGQRNRNSSYHLHRLQQWILNVSSYSGGSSLNDGSYNAIMGCRSVPLELFELPELELLEPGAVVIPVTIDSMLAAKNITTKSITILTPHHNSFHLRRSCYTCSILHTRAPLTKYHPRYSEVLIIAGPRSGGSDWQGLADTRRCLFIGILTSNLLA